MADVSLQNLSEHARGLHGVPAQCVPAPRARGTRRTLHRAPGRPRRVAPAPHARRRTRRARRDATQRRGRAGAAAACARCSADTCMRRIRSVVSRAAATSCACTACSSLGRSSPPRWGRHGARPRAAAARALAGVPATGVCPSECHAPRCSAFLGRARCACAAVAGSAHARRWRSACRRAVGLSKAVGMQRSTSARGASICARH